MLRVKIIEKFISTIYRRFPSFYEYIINKKHGKIKKWVVKIQDVEILFSAEDTYSRIWLHKRCGEGKIHEEKVINLLVENLNSSKCFVDVGTHLGYYTCIASKFMPNGIIYGFEMDDLNYSLTKKNLELNEIKNTHIYQTAVTNLSGTVKYIRETRQPSPIFSLSADTLQEENDHVITVKSITLDDFFKDKKTMPDVIKIDVEGAEMKVLEGMKHLMKHGNLKIFVEVHPQKLLNHQSSTNEVILRLLDEDYTIFEIENFRKSGEDINLKRLNRSSHLQDDAMLYAQRKHQS